MSEVERWTDVTLQIVPADLCLKCVRCRMPLKFGVGPIPGLRVCPECRSTYWVRVQARLEPEREAAGEEVGKL